MYHTHGPSEPNLLEKLVTLLMEEERGILGNVKASGQFCKSSNMGGLLLIGKTCLLSVDLILNAVSAQALSVSRRFKGA